ncbi:protein-export chaperone SecB [Marinimicrococcus flavescens]|uniref:Protein-export protein SecB n=1 Tax=Marinimicrococcus flavescens TaxID=3031815 RepID=A0AAP3XPH0_9PROT|nr:protein-export chaperone SecB [Marinimicrococcus flavescens]
MTDNSSTPPAGAQPDAQNAAPRLSILTQYVKDMSFENPRAPGGLGQGQPRPEIQIGVDTRAQAVADGHYEVSIELNVEAKSGETTVFLLELSYGGVFALANIPDDSLQPLLLIECPRLLFPFVRRIVSDVTRDGGFPPLLLDPIDFVTLYRRRLQQAQQQGQDGGAAPTAEA